MECCKTKDEEGCCKDLKKSGLSGHKDSKSNPDGSEGKGGGCCSTMNTRMVLWIVIGVLFITALFVTFNAGALGGGDVTQAASVAVQSAPASAGGMVGGC